jgi:iron-sulfur cluster repair protein YtfE (RIC family)
MMTEHQKEEDSFFFPWILQHSSHHITQHEFSIFQEEHNSLDAKEKKINELVSELKRGHHVFADISHELLDYTQKYTEHVQKEEKLLVSALMGVPNETQNEMVQEMKKRGSGHAQGKFAFLLFRDTAISNESDRQVWEKTMPWFVRRIVLPILGLVNGDYSLYSKYFNRGE